MDITVEAMEGVFLLSCMDFIHPKSKREAMEGYTVRTGIMKGR